MGLFEELREQRLKRGQQPAFDIFGNTIRSSTVKQPTADTNLPQIPQQYSTSIGSARHKNESEASETKDKQRPTGNQVKSDSLQSATQTTQEKQALRDQAIQLFIKRHGQ